MKIFRVVSIFTVGVLFAALAFAATEKEELPTAPLTQQSILQSFGFFDEDCDGINDLARDSDNDGIPNCQDPDWVRPRDGDGFQSRHGNMHKNANKQNVAGPHNYNNNYLWNNNWAINNPDLCNPTTSTNSQSRNRRSKGKH